MATRKELIENIKALTNDESIVNDLSEMSKNELMQTLEYVEKLDSFNQESEDFSNQVEDPIITEEVKEVVEEEINEDSELVWSKKEELEDVVEEEVKIAPIDEYVEFKKPSELSMAEQRAYARTGVLPIKKK